jgi:hypothetical protein
MLDLTGVLQTVSRTAAPLFARGTTSLSGMLAQSGVETAPLIDPDQTGEVHAIALEETGDSLLVRGQIEGAWRDVAILEIAGEDPRLFLLLGGRSFLERHRRRRVWSRGRIVAGVLDSIQLPLIPACDWSEVLDRLRGQLPADLDCHGVGLDDRGAPLHLCRIEAACASTDEEMDQLVSELYRITTEELYAIRQCLSSKRDTDRARVTMRSTPRQVYAAA